MRARIEVDGNKKRTDNRPHEDNTNYNFLLKCMAVLAAATVITVGVIAATTIHAGAAAVTAVAANTLVSATIFSFIPLVPMALVLIAAICLVPFLFGNSNSSSLYTAVNPSYRTGYPYRGPSLFYAEPHYHGNRFPNTVFVDNNNHGHGGGVGGTHHEHRDSGGTMHGHAIGGNTHGHH